MGISLSVLMLQLIAGFEPHKLAHIECQIFLDSHVMIKHTIFLNYMLVQYTLHMSVN
jgi:hypothetical protein